MPGTDPGEATRTIFGELPELPHLPELPARGPGADLIGRTAAHLTDLHVDLQPAGWRLVPRPGLDERRGRALLREDLDTLEEVAQGYTGSLKVQLCGPLTLAAGVELPRGDRALSDVGAVRDLAASLSESVAMHLRDVGRRVPGARLLLQLDEPGLPSVLAGRLPTASGFYRLPAVEESVAIQLLRRVVDAAHAEGAAVVFHCCAADPPVPVFVAAGASAVSVDALLVRLDRYGPYDESLGEGVESGVALWAGLVPAGGDVSSDARATVHPVRSLWHRLGLDPSTLADRVVVTPTCGLADASPESARATLALARAAARSLVDDPEV
jgi:Cobalamin-independent synthase, Catalytic domain